MAEDRGPCNCFALPTLTQPGHVTNQHSRTHPSRSNHPRQSLLPLPLVSVAVICPLGQEAVLSIVSIGTVHSISSCRIHHAVMSSLHWLGLLNILTCWCRRKIFADFHHALNPCPRTTKDWAKSWALLFTSVASEGQPPSPWTEPQIRIISAPFHSTSYTRHTSKWPNKIYIIM